MVRVKIPTGALSGAQMRRLADVAETFSRTGMSHLTTRQDVQFHYIDLDRVPDVLRLLAEVGLTTREACGNSVRNVTACPVTGYIADELFNVQPYALATYAFLVRNPFCQQMARKFKIAFSSCPEDCASTAIHDIGLVGRIVEKEGRPVFGFKVIVGGGLGSTPFVAQALEEIVPLDSFLLTVKGILQVFSTYGNRRNKMKARLKFVVHRLGIEEFRERVRAAIAEMTDEERREAEIYSYVPDRYVATVSEHLVGRRTVWSATNGSATNSGATNGNATNAGATNGRATNGFAAADALTVLAEPANGNATGKGAYANTISAGQANGNQTIEIPATAVSSNGHGAIAIPIPVKASDDGRTVTTPANGRTVKDPAPANPRDGHGTTPTPTGARTATVTAVGAGLTALSGAGNVAATAWSPGGLVNGLWGEAADRTLDAAFLRWQSASVRRHRNAERAVVTVLFPLGDLEAPRLRALAGLVTAYAADEARVAINQNLFLPNVKRSQLRALYDGLVTTGLAEASAGTAIDVTSCPGADTCSLGITSSKGLARAIRSELLPLTGNGDLDLLRDVTIKISGCPNSCGQHHVANIGFHGVAKKVGGRMVPAYQLHLGGRIANGEARIGKALDKIPAKNVPGAVAALLRLYRKERNGDEPFAEFVVRHPREAIEAELRPFAEAVPEDGEIDWGQDDAFTTDEIGTGECAGAGTDVAIRPFDNYEAELLQARLFIEREQWVDALANLNRSQYTLARILLERLGRHPDSDYETACELRSQVIDRGCAGDLWNDVHAEIDVLLRTRTPEPAGVRALYDRALELLREAEGTLPVLDRRKAEGAGEIPG
jgi:sulfite reductase beta subunit-like hemoprotein